MTEMLIMTPKSQPRARKLLQQRKAANMQQCVCEGTFSRDEPCECTKMGALPHLLLMRAGSDRTQPPDQALH